MSATMSDHARRVREMFRSVAPRYDLLNHLLSFNLDRRWRRIAVRLAFDDLDHHPRETVLTETSKGIRNPKSKIENRKSKWVVPPVVLDLCAGTGDLAVELARHCPGAQIVALDFVVPMLVRARAKTCRAEAAGCILPLCGDAFHLPFRDRSFDLLTVAFGLRNLSPVEGALGELARVIRPGGRLVVLEFALPAQGMWRRLYGFYFSRVLPRIGNWVSGTSAYSYLPPSVALFPEPQALGEMFERNGFEQANWRPLAGGIVALHTATLRAER